MEDSTVASFTEQVTPIRDAGYNDLWHPDACLCEIPSNAHCFLLLNNHPKGKQG
jgi:hypothetical protein